MKMPNIVMIVTDQHRLDGVGIYNKTPYGVHVKTENLDRLAREGIRFENAFTPCPLCSPARTSLLTGTYPHSHKTMTNTNLHPIDNQISPEQDLMIQALKERNYQTGYVGKWHVNNDLTPADFGYDQYIGLSDYNEYRISKGYDLTPESQHYETAKGSVGTDPIPLEYSRPVYLANQAVSMIENYVGKKEPFFVRLDFHGPHFPIVIPEPYASMYDPSEITPIPSFFDDFENKPEVQAEEKKYWHVDKMKWEDWQPIVAKYYGEISLIDHEIGRVLSALEKLEIQEDTLVIFTTDHGDLMGAHGLWNKIYTMYDDTLRVPLIMRWPGKIAPNSVCSEFVMHFVDMLPTMLDILQVEKPETLEGQSFLPLLFGEEQKRDKCIVSESHGGHMGLYSMRALRTEKYKYIYHGAGRDELYNLEEDPYEMHNLIDEESCAEILKNLRVKLVKKMQATKDHLFNQFVVSYLTEDEELTLMAPGRRNTKW